MLTEAVSEPRTRLALNQLSLEVMDLCEAFARQNADVLRLFTDQERAEYIVALMAGWLVGFGPGRLEGADRDASIARLLEAAAFGARVAGESVEKQRNSDRNVH